MARHLAEGNTQAQVARALGLSRSTVAYHARRVLPPDPRFTRRYDWAAVQEFYDQGCSISDLGGGFKEDRCERCGIDAWCDAPLCVQVHHVNGDPLDNRLENLMLLCPNCHSQTDNSSGRNRRRPGAG